MPSLRHCYPVNHRPARVSERRRYYSKLDFSLVERWFAERPVGLRNPVFHLDAGTETRFARREYRDKRDRLLYFTVESLGELKGMVMEYLPEDLYYDRNVYKDKEACSTCGEIGEGCRNCENWLGQELMFDIDPENIDCPNCGTLEDRVKGASMFKFCYICFNKAIDETLRLNGWLESGKLGATFTVYSGRGFHIYVEEEKALAMPFNERERLAEEVKNQGFPIDPWVTSGEARLARVPYSLNGLVSKICQPILINEIKKLDFWRSRQFVPDFI
jgi:hypothetical protein